MKTNKLWKLLKTPSKLVFWSGSEYKFIKSFLWASISPTKLKESMSLKTLRTWFSEIALLVNSDLFDSDWYLSHNTDVASAGIDPVVHYLKFGAAEGRDPNPLFDSNWYLAQYSDVAQEGLNPLVHYLKFGAAEGRDPNPLFDSDWYLTQYPDVAEAGANPLVHYLKFGAAEGRDPNSLFDSDWYLAQYPDVAEAGLNPLAHFLKEGMAEGRRFNSLGSSAKNLSQSLLPSANPAVNNEISTGIQFAETFHFSLAQESGQGLFLEAIANLSQRIPDLVIYSVAPEVSIIIPVYGQLTFALNCLDSLCEHQSEYSVEIIVLDDASPEATQIQLIAQIPWVRYVCQEENAGFTKNCNYGASLAKGSYLVFLNSDTRVVAGWLDEMLLTFKLFPNAGLVGSKLLNDDGSLQEAGGLFWNDGSAWNFGRGDDPNLPQYNYARRVDYCSGAALAIPKVIWQEVGGFDEIYAPAYCEDADLAFRLREINYDTLYQPLSQVIHYEGKTHGRDVKRGVKAYQVENLKKLRNRWQEQLSSYYLPGVEPDRAKDRFAKRRVLFLEHCTPTPDQDAGSLLDFNIMLLLRDMDFQVTFIPEDNFIYVPGYTENLQRHGIEVLHKPYVTSVVQHLQASENRYDLVFICRWRVSNRHICSVRQHCLKAKVIFYPHDLHYFRLAREAQILNDPEKMAIAEAEKDQELEAVRTADASIVVSTFERELLKQEVPDENVHVWPLILDVIGTKNSYTQRQDIVFVGGYRHTPNVDAVKYFARDVMPLLRPELPGVRFFAVGSNPPEELQNLAGEDVIISGFVEDLNSLYDTMRVSVAPLRFGAGIKGKVGTAMAAGLPVVATEIATEGMGLTPDEHILVGNKPEDLAAAIIRVYDNETLWNQLSQAGVEFSKQTWGAESAWFTLNNILKNFDMGTERNGKPLTLYSLLKREENRSGNQLKIQQELNAFKDQINVHDLPRIYHYWSNKYIKPMFLEAGFESVEDFFASNFIQTMNQCNSSPHLFISIGSGNCDLEISIGEILLERGYHNFSIECMEINADMLERGKALAKQKGLTHIISFSRNDFNQWLSNKTYDGIMANHSLHHVLNIEHLFDQIKKSLHPKGRFIINDMIGRNGHQRWPEALEIVNSFWKELPSEYRYNTLLERYEEDYENWDCSIEGFEGIRAQDILPLLMESFHCHKFLGFGNVVDIFVDRFFGHHFNPDFEWDRNFIDRLHETDEAGFREGRLTPTHMLAVFVKELSSEPYYVRGLDPWSSIRDI